MAGKKWSDGTIPVATQLDGSEILMSVQGGSSTALPSSLLVLNKEVQLSSIDILSLNSIPIEAIPAPGPNKFIRIIAITWVLNFGTTPYNGNGMRLLIPAAQVSIWNSYTASSSSINTTNLSTLSNIDPVDWVDQPIKIDVGSANPTGGDGTVRIFISYCILNFSS